jgi:hypothetical protein
MTLQDLIDRQQITDVLHDYCRGIDQMDRGLVLSCWHDGGTDTHGVSYTGTAAGFIDWVWPYHEAMALTRHTITNIAIGLDGDTAQAECCWTVRMVDENRPAGQQELLATGRYLDRFERIDGRWAMRHRESVRERVWTHAQTIAEDSQA